jgi:hypothetical protein
LLLTPADSHLTILGHSNSSFLSGGVPVDSATDPLTWTRVAPPPRPAFEQRAGVLSQGLSRIIAAHTIHAVASY